MKQVLHKAMSECEEPTMSECKEPTDHGPCQICMVRREISTLKDAIERKISLVQFLIVVLNKTLEEAKELTQPQD